MTAIDLHTPHDIAEQVDALKPWFHNLHLPDGTQTCPDHWLGDFPSFKWQQIAGHLPPDLHGWSCLDIGCNAGFYSFELARRGATVLGIDLDEHYLAQARWAAERYRLRKRVEFRRMQIYDLVRLDDAFDLVWFMGVLYHLRYPMLALDIVCRKVRRLMAFQTLTLPGQEVFEATDNRRWEERDLMTKPGWPKMAFLEHGFAGDPTNRWAPNHAAVEAMLRDCGMTITARPGHEMYLCRPNSSDARPDDTEFQSATGTRRQ